MDKNGKSPAKGEGLIEFSGSFNIKREDTRFPASLKELKELKAKHFAEKFPSVPVHARGKAKPYSDRTANGQSHAIKEAQSRYRDKVEAAWKGG